MSYTPPNVQVTSIANTRIINISENARIPAVVGYGPSVRYITDEVVTRISGTGSSYVDYLSNYGVTVTRVSPFPTGLTTTGSYSSWSGSWSTGTGTSATSLGYIQWNSGTEGSSRPYNGEVYYVSYNYPVPSTQFEPQTFTDSDDVSEFYGKEDVANGIVSSSIGSPITTAAKIILEAGAPAVICQQVSGTSDAAWADAFEKLKVKGDVSYVVPLNTTSTVQTSALIHCLVESTASNAHERECIFGMNSGSTIDQIIARAEALNNQRAVLVAPCDNITRSVGSTVLSLDGTYAAAALAGLICSQEKPITPVTGMIITGISFPDDIYKPYDMNRMAGSGVCILYSKSGIIKVRDAITTDPTNADTQEISIVASDDLVRRITRTQLENTYNGKGIVIDSGTPGKVAATTKSIWTTLVDQGFIKTFGTKFDPTTGEVPITAQQDPYEPRRIDVAGAVSYLYPLKFINVQFAIYV
jgi:hypothetical protein